MEEIEELIPKGESHGPPLPHELFNAVCRTHAFRQLEPAGMNALSAENCR
ncbi:MAG: hypothetical protein V4718_10800 [Pseudomonadota bacterium]